MFELESIPASVELNSANACIHPLSWGQQRLWAHQQVEPHRPIYNIPIAYHLTGSIDPDILQSSLTAIIQRHDILRTTIATVSGQPMQAVSPQMEVSLPVVDLRHLPSAEQDARSTKQALEDAQTQFDLNIGPLWRFQLLQLSDEQSILLFTIHHIISDRWSLDLWMGELALVYEALMAGDPAPGNAPAKQYADYTAWQNQWVQGKRWDSQLAYWKQQLGGNPAPLELPIDRTRSFASTSTGARQSLTFHPELTAALKHLSDGESVTPFMTLLAAFAVLLYQYTQQEDQILCTPVAGRHRAETKGVQGYFNNILPLRLDLSGNPSFQELIARARQVSLGAYKNMDLPFQAIADLPELARTPLARVLLALQPGANDTLSLPHLTIRYPKFQNVHNGTANVDLALFLEEKDGAWTGAIDYKTDLFDTATIAQIIAQFQQLLATLITNPQLRLETLPCLRKAALLKPSETTYVAPNKAIERTIAEVCQEMLQLEKVGIHHNFFELGAHSLMMVKICDRLNTVLNQKLAIVDLFRYPTIHTLAQYLSQEPGQEHPAFGHIQDSAQRRKAAFQKQKQLRQQRSKIHG